MFAALHPPAAGENGKDDGVITESMIDRITSENQSSSGSDEHGGLALLEHPSAVASLLSGEKELVSRLRAYETSPEEFPSWFATEVGLPSDVSNLKATEDWSIIGFEYAGSRETCMERLCSCFAEKGWVAAQEGAGEALNFVKSEGEQRWMLVNCLAFEESCAFTLFLKGR